MGGPLVNSRCSSEAPCTVFGFVHLNLTREGSGRWTAAGGRAGPKAAHCMLPPIRWGGPYRFQTLNLRICYTPADLLTHAKDSIQGPDGRLRRGPGVSQGGRPGRPPPPPLQICYTPDETLLSSDGRQRADGRDPIPHTVCYLPLGGAGPTDFKP